MMIKIGYEEVDENLMLELIAQGIKASNSITYDDPDHIAFIIADKAAWDITEKTKETFSNLDDQELDYIYENSFDDIYNAIYKAVCLKRKEKKSET